MQNKTYLINSLINYAYLFCIVIYAGSATVFARSLGDMRTIGNFFALVFTGLIIGQNRIKFNKDYILSIVVFISYSIITFIANHHFSPFWCIRWLISFTIAYCLCYVFGYKLFKAYEKIIVLLCLISIPLWISLVLFPDLTTSLVKSFSFFEVYHDADNVYANMIVFSVPPKDYLDNEFILLQRNYGFTWEPGAFATFICLAIFCNFLRNKMTFRGNFSLWLLIITLMSTQSTTGFVIIIILVFLGLFLRKRYWLCLLVIPLLVVLFSLPFVRDKIIEEFVGLQSIDVSNATGAMGRLYSLQLDFQEFKRHPFFGLGGYTGGTWLSQKGYTDIVTISGLGKLLSMFGSIMAILFFVVLTKSSIFISSIFRSKLGYLLIVVIIFSMISYDLWTHPLFISFWMFVVYFNKRGLQTTTQRFYHYESVPLNK